MNKEAFFSSINSVSEAPTASEQALIKENSFFWSQYTGGKHTKSANGYMLVEHDEHPSIILCNASFATIISIARNLRPIFILSSPKDISIKQVLESYYLDCAFVYLNTWRRLIPRLLAYLPAMKAFRKLKSPADILQLSYDGIKYGDLFYDRVLDVGYATIGKLDRKFLRAIRAFFWHRHVVRDIFKRYEIKAAVFSHMVGLKRGTYTRHLLKNGIELHNLSGSYQIQLKKYQSLNDVGFYCLKPEPRYFSFLMNHGYATMLRLADKY